MPDEADPVRGKLIAMRHVEFPGTLSPGKKPPRQGQSVAVPHPCTRGKFARRNLFVESGSAAYSNTTAVRHEYFGQTMV
jgi:hypothetical protein